MPGPRQRIGTVDEAAKGGGGGPAPTGNFGIGPDYGETPPDAPVGPGGGVADDDTTMYVGAAADLEQVNLTADLEVQPAVSLDEVNAAYDLHQLDAAVDLEQVNPTYDLHEMEAVVDLEQVNLTADLAVEAAANLEQVNPTFSLHEMDMVLTGSVFGPPQVRSFDHATNSASPITVTKPAGTVQGDLMVASVATGAPVGFGAPTAPSGWTLITSTTQTTSGLFAYYKVAGASEPGSYSWTIAGTTPHNVAGIVTLFGIDPSTPIDASNFNSAADTSTTITVPSATSTVANTMRLAFGGCYAQTNTAIYTYTQAAGFQEMWDDNNYVAGLPPGTSTAAAWRVLAAVGASGNADMTRSGSALTNNQEWGIQVLVRPDPAGVVIA